MKVHFAGYISGVKGADLAGVQYVLDSYWILRKKSPANLKSYIGHMNEKKGKILDSGLFTLMFGAKSGGDLTEEFFNEWQTAYIHMIRISGFAGAVVLLRRAVLSRHL